MSRGRRTNRIAYVMKESDLPLPGAEWQPDKKFSVADELLNTGLEGSFQRSAKNGRGIAFSA